MYRDLCVHSISRTIQLHIESTSLIYITPVTYTDHCMIFQNEVVQLREQLESWKEHGCKRDRERVPSFNEDSFVDSTSQDEVQYLKAIINKLQEEKQQWSKNVNEH